MGEVYRARDTRLDRGDPLASAKLGVNGVGRNTVTLSPDGSLLVYVGERNGQSQLYRRPLNEFEVKPIPSTEGAGKWQISTDGAEEIVWARNGRELFYRQAQQWMSVAIQLEPDFHAEVPKSCLRDLS